MQDSMYSAMFGALTQEHRLAVIANNLANVNTNGYKRVQLSFKDVMVRFAHDDIMEPLGNLRSKPLLPDDMQLAKVRIAESNVDFSQGSLKQTDGPLDLAIMGDGFFKVRTANGELYTRNGRFVLNAEGVLVTPQGDPVLGEGGEITLPDSGQVLIDPQGRILVDGEQIDQIQVVTVADTKALEHFGFNFYRARQGMDAAETPAENATVAQGFVEAPNVNVVEEMVNMIEAQRAFEAYSKTIETTQETDMKVIGKVGGTT